MITIIGSGAGGGILAKELAEVNIPVTIIEKGPYVETKESFKYYDKYDNPVEPTYIRLRTEEDPPFDDDIDRKMIEESLKMMIMNQFQKKMQEQC